MLMGYAEWHPTLPHVHAHKKKKQEHCRRTELNQNPRKIWNPRWWEPESTVLEAGDGNTESIVNTEPVLEAYKRKLDQQSVQPDIFVQFLGTFVL